MNMDLTRSVIHRDRGNLPRGGETKNPLVELRAVHDGNLLYVRGVRKPSIPRTSRETQKTAFKNFPKNGLFHSFRWRPGKFWSWEVIS
jgi:hypothetical protein